MLEFQWPWLALLLPLPWVARRYLPTHSTQPNTIRVPFFEDLVSTSHQHTHSALLPGCLAGLMWLCLLTAAARPVWYGEPVNVAISGRDLLLAIDISDSMRIEDMKRDGITSMRIDVVKSLASEFVKKRQGDRIGLILFGQQAYLQTPLTFDHHAVVSELAEALPGFAGSSTAIGDAMGLAINILRDRPAQSRVVVLLSDGSNTYGSDPLAAITVAAEASIKIHTIGLGSNSYLGEDVIGRKIEVNPSKDLDEQVLLSIANNTGGSYFRAHNPAELSSIYGTIDNLEPAPAEEFIRPRKSLYHWLLAAGLMCGVFLVGLKNRA